MAVKKTAQQEIILNSFVEAQNLEKILLDKVREYGKEVMDNQTKALLKQIEIMVKNHKEDIKKAEKLCILARFPKRTCLKSL